MKSILVFGLVLSFVFSAFGQQFVEVSTKKNVTPRVTLAEVTNIKNADVLETANVPNYIKALAQNTKAAPQFANLIQTFLYGGTVAPETKMAMALKISQNLQKRVSFGAFAKMAQGEREGKCSFNESQIEQTFNRSRTNCDSVTPNF